MSDEEVVAKRKSDPPPPRRRPKKIIIPRRAPSIVIPPKVPYYPSPDKNTCALCTCFPKEDPYVKPKKLNPCLHSPLTLYELAAEVVEGLSYPPAFHWTEECVANWCDAIGLSQYRDCMLENHIDGMRLLMFEDPSKLPEINIRDFKHIQFISSTIRSMYGMDFIRFSRSVGLPPRRPLVHCNWFKSRTGPSWGIRKNWTRGDILRWMKILMPAPVYRDHWEMVWYLKPDFPCVKIARVDKAKSQVHIPHYKKQKERCTEYLVPRKFKFQTSIPDSAQMIWLEHRPCLVEEQKKKKREKEEKKKEKKLVKFIISKDSNLIRKKVTTEGLKGNDLILARRQMPKPKFLP